MENQQRPADNSKLYSILAYVLILWLVGLFAAPEKDNPFVKDHVNNGIILTIIGFVVSGLGFIPVVGGIIAWLGGIVLLGVAIVGIVMAAQDKPFNIPVISDFKILK